MCCLVVARTSAALWIDESPLTLYQRERLQRGRTSFFIVLVPMNGRVKFAMTGCGWSVLLLPRPVDTCLRGNDGDQDSKSHSLDSPVDSRLRGNDGEVRVACEVCLWGWSC